MVNYKVALIKIKEGTTVYNNAEKYLNTGFKYYVNDDNLNNVSKSLILYCNDNCISTLHWCECQYNKVDDGNDYLLCKVLYSSNSPVVIRNACDSIFLDIESDFKEQYIEIET